MKLQKSLWAPAFLATILCLGIFSKAMAQEAIRFQPAIIGDGAGQTIEPGKSFESSVRATNLSNETVTYDVIVEDIKDQVNGSPVFADPSENSITGIKNWVAFPVNKVTLKAGETKEIQFVISVPKDAFPGSHFGSIMLSRQAAKPGVIGSGIGFQAGPVIIIRVPGDISETAGLREFSKDKGIYSSPAVNFSLKVENLGNVLIRPRGPIDIYNMWGKKIDTIVVNEEYASIFPKKDRTFTVSWKGEGFYFGRYDAVASLVYGADARRTISGSVSFWILPLNIILPVAGGIIILVLAIVFILRWYVSRRLRELAPGAPRMPTERSGQPFGRLMFMTLTTIVFVIVLLAILFLLFGS